MDKKSSLAIFYIFLILSIILAGSEIKNELQATGGENNGEKITPQTFVFVHPGSISSKKDLDFIKYKINEGAQPWTNVFLKVKNLATRGSNALVYVNSKNQNQANISKNEAKKAYANALAWYFTDQEIYAKQAIAILNSWAGLQGFSSGSDQDKLQAGWIGALLGPAAEIMRGYSGWVTTDMQAVQKMFRRAFYPQLKTASSWNGNVDLTQIDALMSIAIFNEDEDAFRLGIKRFKTRVPAYFFLSSDTKVPSIQGDGGNTDVFWHNPIKWVDGLTQETCRDNNHHSQYGMASALHAAEMAWNQGIDLYTPNAERFIAVMELMATQILTGEMQGTCDNNNTTSDLYATWEIGYNHYHNRKGRDLPNTKKLIIEQVRIKGESDWNIFYETLTHANIEYKSN